MSGSVDTRLVELQFDNSQFEKGVSQSLKTIDELNESLQFKDTPKGATNITQAFVGGNNSVVGAINQVQNSFSLMQVAAKRAIENITDYVMGLGGKIVQSIFRPLTDGFSKYGEKNSSIKTILSAIGNKYESEDAALAAVESSIEKLAWYSDETSYSLTDMTSNIAKFTSTGADLEKSTDVMMGIASATALAGQNAQAASRVMYNMAQAYGAGSVKLIDWKSVENANVATESLKKTIIESAEELGYLEKKVNKKTGEVTYKTTKKAGKKGKDVSISDFNGSLTYGWFTSEVMEQAFGTYTEFTNALYEQVENTGHNATTVLKAIEAYKKGTATEEQTKMVEDILNKMETDIDTLQEGVGMLSFKAAQEARTFKDAVSAIQDVMSSAWSDFFVQLFGDQEDSAEIWTWIANEISTALYEIPAAFTSILEVWNLLEGRERTFEAIKSIWDSLAVVFGTAAEALDNAFGEKSIIGKEQTGIETLGVALSNVTLGLQKFAWAFADFFNEESEEGKKNIEDLSNAFGALFGFLNAIFKIGQAVIKSLKPVVDIFVDFGKAALSLAGTVGGYLTAMFESLKANKAYEKLSKGLSRITGLFAGKIKSLTTAFLTTNKLLPKLVARFKTFGEGISNAKSIGEVFLKTWTWIKGSLSDIWNSLKEWSAKFPGLANALGKIETKFKGIKDKLIDSVPALKNWVDGFIKAEDKLGYLGTTLSKLWTSIKAKFSTWVDIFNKKGMKGVLEDILDTLKGWGKRLLNWILGFFKGDKIGGESIADNLLNSGASALEKLKGLKDIIVEKLSKVFLDVLDWLKTFWTGRKDEAKEVSDGLVKTVTTSADKAAAKIKEWFNKIKTWFSEFSIDDISKPFSGLAEKIESKFPSLGEIFSHKITMTAGEFKLLGEQASETVASEIAEGAKTLGKVLESPDGASTVVQDAVGKVFEPGKTLEDISGKAKKWGLIAAGLFASYKSFTFVFGLLRNIGSILGNLKSIVKAYKIKERAEAFKDVGIGVAGLAVSALAIAGSMYLFSLAIQKFEELAKDKDYDKVLGDVLVIFVAIAAAMVGINLVAKGAQGVGIGTGISIIAMVGSLFLIAMAIERFSKISPQTIERVLPTIEKLILVIGVFAMLASNNNSFTGSNGGKFINASINLESTALSILALVPVLYAVADLFERFSDFPKEKLTTGVHIISAILLVIGTTIFLTNSSFGTKSNFKGNGLTTIFSLIAIIGAIKVVGNVLTDILETGSKPKDIAVAGAVIFGILAAIAAILLASSKADIANKDGQLKSMYSTCIGMVILSASLLLVGKSLSMVLSSAKSTADIAMAGLILASLMGLMAGLVLAASEFKLGSNKGSLMSVVAICGGMIALAVAMKVVADALSVMMSTSMTDDAIKQSGKSMAMVFGIMAAVLAIGAVLGMTGVGFAAIGAMVVTALAFVVLAEALYKASLAISIMSITPNAEKGIENINHFVESMAEILSNKDLMIKKKNTGLASEISEIVGSLYPAYEAIEKYSELDSEKADKAIDNIARFLDGVTKPLSNLSRVRTGRDLNADAIAAVLGNISSTIPMLKYLSSFNLTSKISQDKIDKLKNFLGVISEFAKSVVDVETSKWFGSKNKSTINADAINAALGSIGSVAKGLRLLSNIKPDKAETGAKNLKAVLDAFENFWPTDIENTVLWGAYKKNVTINDTAITAALNGIANVGTAIKNAGKAGDDTEITAAGDSIAAVLRAIQACYPTEEQTRILWGAFKHTETVNTTALSLMFENIGKVADTLVKATSGKNPGMVGTAGEAMSQIITSIGTALPRDTSSSILWGASRTTETVNVGGLISTFASLGKVADALVTASSAGDVGLIDHAGTAIAKVVTSCGDILEAAKTKNILGGVYSESVDSEGIGKTLTSISTLGSTLVELGQIDDPSTLTNASANLTTVLTEVAKIGETFKSDKVRVLWGLFESDSEIGDISSFAENLNSIIDSVVKISTVVPDGESAGNDIFNYLHRISLGCDAIVEVFQDRSVEKVNTRLNSFATAILAISTANASLSSNNSGLTSWLELLKGGTTDESKLAGSTIVDDIITGMESGKLSLTIALAKIIVSILSSLRSQYSSMSSAGSYMMSGLKQGIKDSEPIVIAQSESTAKAIIAAFKKALLIASPSRVMMELGGYVDQGLAVGIKDSTGVVVDSTNYMSDEVLESISEAIGNINEIITSDIDTDPTIKPVLDLSNVKRNSRTLNSMFEGTVLSAKGRIATITSEKASSVSSTANKLQSGSESLQSQGSSNVTYVQNNYSPKALTQKEIYRQTSNQIAMIKRNNMAKTKGGVTAQLA